MGGGVGGLRGANKAKERGHQDTSSLKNVPLGLKKVSPSIRRTRQRHSLHVPARTAPGRQTRPPRAPTTSDSACEGAPREQGPGLAGPRAGVRGPVQFRRP